MKLILNIFILSFLTVNVFAQGISLEFVNKQLVGNTWSFDLRATVDNTYPGDWSTMNVRTNIAVPAGTTISSFTGTPVHNSVSSAVGQTSFAGGSVAGTLKYAVALDRANSMMPDVMVGSTVVLASFSVTFSQTVPAANLVTPRQFGSSAQSFFTTQTDPTARPFVLPVNFPLPIVLTSFEATKYLEKDVKLNWTTTSEINSAYFGIERSQDNTIWEPIGQVRAAGNSNLALNYEFIDTKLPLIRTKDQIFYYRLQMTDLDGNFKYSDVRGVNFGRSLSGLVTIYPNPTAQHINVDLSGIDLDGGNVELSVIDMNGRRMIQKNIIGNGIELIDVYQLPAATYNVVVKQGNSLYKQSIIKID